MAEPDKVVKIDGALTSDETRDRCIFEQNEGFRLTAIANQTMSQDGQVLNFNKAEFDGDIDFFAELLFEEPGGNDPDQIKEQKKAAGWTFICSGSIWVENEITNVMVFGK